MVAEVPYENQMVSGLPASVAVCDEVLVQLSRAVDEEPGDELRANDGEEVDELRANDGEVEAGSAPHDQRIDSVCADEKDFPSLETLPFVWQSVLSQFSPSLLQKSLRSLDVQFVDENPEPPGQSPSALSRSFLTDPGANPIHTPNFSIFPEQTF